MEEEWGKLIIEMLEREKLLRPAVERSVWGRPLLPWLGGDGPKPLSHSAPLWHHRLELLLQIANKIQNGALSCEEKLTLAKNTLQAVSGGALPPFLIFLPLPLSSVWGGWFSRTPFLSLLMLRGGGGNPVITQGPWGQFVVLLGLESPNLLYVSKKDRKSFGRKDSGAGCSRLGREQVSEEAVLFWEKKM